MRFFTDVFDFEPEVVDDPVMDQTNRALKIQQSEYMPLNLGIHQRHSRYYNDNHISDQNKYSLSYDVQTVDELRRKMDENLKHRIDLKVKATQDDVFKDIHRPPSYPDYLIGGYPTKLEYQATPGALRNNTVRYHTNYADEPEVLEAHNRMIEQHRKPVPMEIGTLETTVSNYVDNDGSITPLSDVEAKLRSMEDYWEHGRLQNYYHYARANVHNYMPTPNPIRVELPNIIAVSKRQMTGIYDNDGNFMSYT